MKSKILISFLFISQIVFSQVFDYAVSKPGKKVGPHKGYLGVSGGSAISYGSFRSTNYNSSTSGYAKTGGGVTLSFGYKTRKYVGIASVIQWEANKIDESKYIDVLAPSQFVGNQSQYAGDRIIHSKAWRTASAMLGGYASFYIFTKDMSFTMRALAGVSQVQSPSVEVDIATGPNTGNWVKQESVTSPLTFVYQLGFGFKYDTGDQVCLLLNFDYLNTQPQFNNVATTSSYIMPYSRSYSQNIELINIMFGIGYIIEKL